MPTYCYQCSKCTKAIEIFHSMSEVDKPTEETIEQTTCKKHGRMKRVPQLPQLMGSSEGTFKNEAQLRQEKKAQRKQRSRMHFKNEVLPHMKETPKILDHFKNKTKNLGKKDHEKM